MSGRSNIPESKAIGGWLFLADGRRMWQEPYDLIVEGGTYVMDPVGFRWCGLEPSEQPIDAVLNARGSVCCRVRAWGEVLRGRDRFVASSVRVEWIEDASDVLMAFADETAGQRCSASQAIRAAMPAVVRDASGKADGRANERAMAEVARRLNERLAGMLMGLRPGRIHGDEQERAGGDRRPSASAPASKGVLVAAVPQPGPHRHR